MAPPLKWKKYVPAMQQLASDGFTVKEAFAVMVFAEGHHPTLEDYRNAVHRYQIRGHKGDSLLRTRRAFNLKDPEVCKLCVEEAKKRNTTAGDLATDLLRIILTPGFYSKTNLVDSILDGDDT